nr:PREDICTED: uncharacterized protein LOC109039515 [Bemisia tabaci]
MYTNIPIKLALNVITEKWPLIVPHTTLPKEQFLEGIRACLDSTIFKFGEDCYKRIDGLAMGGPVSASVANLVMEYFEEKMFEVFPYKTLFYKRFADDIILCCHKDDLNSIYQFFNMFSSNIKFSIEYEANNAIAFLDVLVIKQGSKFVTSWFTKPTFSGRYLNFLSAQPLSQKINVIKNLARRVCLLTHPMLRKEKIREAKKLLFENCYPKHRVNSIFENVVKFCYDGFPPPKLFEKTEFVVRPYVSSCSEKIRSVLKPHGYTLVTSNKSNLQNFQSCSKSKIPTEKLSGVVYEIPCGDCQGIYIGQSSQYLHKRLDGHKFNQHEVTALKQHMREKGHSFDFNNTRVLKRERNEQIRLNLEGLCILNNQNAVNSRTEFAHFEEYFSNL